MDKPSVGRIVHFIMPNGEHRPAVIVRDWNQPNGLVNLQVFTDGMNDGGEYQVGLVWRTSVAYSEEKTPYTWHWPERA